MRDDELRRTLSDANPWWAAKAAGRDPTTWQEANRTLRDRRQFDLGYLRELIEQGLDDLEDAYLGAAALEAHRRSGEAAIPLDVLMQDLGLED